MPETRPAETLQLQPSFGFGDRLGLATPGHLQALNEFGEGIAGIFAQQSIREMQRTGRTAEQVMGDAVSALNAANFTGRWSADADHLKTEEDIELTANAGFVFFTIDPSDYVDDKAEDYSPENLKRQYEQLLPEAAWSKSYLGQTVKIDDGPTISFDSETVRRATVKYGRAVARAIRLSNHIDRVMGNLGKNYEIELSVDETSRPTSLAEHFMVAEQCLTSGMKLISLAPRYVGDFEKGIDFKGDLKSLESSISDHAAVARQLGPYKLSLHSGSDKLSMYEIFARTTGGLFHVKTAGTSYLEALRVVVRHDERLFRQIVDFSRDRFPIDRATYHISAELEKVAPPAEISDIQELEKVYLDLNDGRQVMHVTFGSVLTDLQLGSAVRNLLIAEPAAHQAVLAEHFGKHLQALKRGF